MANSQKLFSCPICFEGEVIDRNEGRIRCTNCGTPFDYHGETGTYMFWKYSRSSLDEESLNRLKELFRQYAKQKGLSADKWNQIAEADRQDEDEDEDEDEEEEEERRIVLTQKYIHIY